MKKLILFICAILFATLSYSQGEGWIIAKGALNFAKGLIGEEELSREAEVGAMILGEAFSTLGQWSHEKAVAERGKDQLTIQTPEGEQSFIIRDVEGNFYIQQAGVLYPISKEREQTILGFTPKNKLENEFIPPYDLDYVREIFYWKDKIEEIPKKVYTTEKYFVSTRIGEFVEDIAARKGVPIENVNLGYLGKSNSWKNKQKVMKGQKAAPKNSVFHIRKLVPSEPVLQANEIRFVLTCKWIVDFDEDETIDLEEDIHGLKNSFLPGEKITFLLGYGLGKENCKAHLKIYSEFTGNVLFYQEIPLLKGEHLSLKEIANPDFPPGEYLINLKMRDSEKNLLDSYTEKFEIRNIE